MNPMDMNSPVVEMLEVAVAAAQAPDVAVVEGVTWTVGAGDYWVVGGLPGSGKSSLLLTMAGLLRPQRGQHRLFGRDTAGWGEDEAVRERLRIGLVFAEEGRLFHQLTVAENLALPICYHQDCLPAETHDRIAAVLEGTDLASVAHRRPGEISRALRQRAGLARALVMNPDLLVLDNPLRGMDWRQTRWWLDFLSGLVAGHELLGGKRMTLAVATDDLRPWVEQGQKFAVLGQGRWSVLGARAALSEADPILLRELLTGDGAKN